MIDLRSDTVTQPTPDMRDAMATAPVGDDVFGEDPTVNLLQETVARLFAKEAGLFVASGTMGNQVALNAHTQPGDEVICEYNAHIFNYEGGAPALLSGVQLHPIPGTRGVITAAQIEAVIRPDDHHFPHSQVIAIENTHNRAGGTLFPIDEMKRIYTLAQNRNLKVHLDGARIWNASVATGIPLSEYARYADSINVCFSKGLGAPVGSMILGSKDFITRAHRYRKLYGGGMRQAGILAAGALYAVEHNVKRLAEDHRRARMLATALSDLEGIQIDLDAVQTNIVIFEVVSQVIRAGDFVNRCREAGVLMIPFGGNKVRLVTHLHISDDDVARAITIFRDIMSSHK
ncbi:MAG: low-specificity L-threonine aldolase [Calditrichaeota bacterium]|nr:low-specificity L-threonine aldolase [Calditrichota bacterium]